MLQMLSRLNYEASSTSTNLDKYIFQKIPIILVIVGCTYVCLSNTVPAGRFSGQGQVVKFHLASVFCLVSERPVFKTWFSA